jgi:hypothetical protein
MPDAVEGLGDIQKRTSAIKFLFQSIGDFVYQPVDWVDGGVAIA